MYIRRNQFIITSWNFATCWTMFIKQVACIINRMQIRRT